MKKSMFAVSLLLCCLSLAIGGCAKKELVKDDDSLARTGAVTKPADDAAATTPVPIAQDSVVKEEATVSPEALKPFDTVYFDFDSYVLRQDARDSLDKNATWLKSNAGQKVRLEGHCDERGSDEYNLALGEKRARAAMNYLVTLGISADRLATISYGKEKPADPGHNDAAWAKNRRVDFVIVK
jgi:peptidoglycan-associated lipoprotein